MKSTIGFLFANDKPYSEFKKLFDFDLFIKHYSIVYIFGANILEANKSQIQIKFGKLFVKVHAFMHNCLLWHKRDMSISYKLKANCYFGSNVKCDQNLSFHNFYKLRRNSYERFAVKIFGTFIGISILSIIIDTYFFFRSFKQKKLLIRFDCIVIPYGGRISIEQDFLIWFCRYHSIKSIAIQENWDNLSSKTLMFKHPDLFGTWGRQSSMHLRRIHNFRGEIIEIGSLRLNEFYTRRNSSIENDLVSNFHYSSNKKSRKNLLLIGTGDAEFDLIIAKQCVNLIKLYADELQSRFHVVYRPHPYSRISEREFSEILNLENITIDKPQKQEENRYRIELIEDATLVIALYSTVILEASILNKPCIVPSFLDSAFTYSTGDYLDEAEHYSGTAFIDSIFNVQTIEEFLGILRRIDHSNLSFSNNPKILNWFCADKNTNNSIFDLVNLAINSNV